MTLREEAQKCTGCLMWLKHCKAACCFQFVAPKETVPMTQKNGNIVIRTRLTPDMIWYFRLRGCRYEHESLMIPVRKFIITQDDKLVHFHNKCVFLQDDFKCKGHPDKKPKFCRDFNPFSKESSNQVYVPKLCVKNFLGGEKE